MSTVIFFTDLHAPFTHPKALDFVKDISDAYGPDEIVCGGDLVDNHALSFHDSDPDGMSCGHELSMARDILGPWFDEFPNARWCLGNHDLLPKRQFMRNGISTAYLKNYHELLGTPITWEIGLNHEIDGVLYVHKTSKAGIYGHRLSAIAKRQSVVVGHSHCYAGVNWMASDHDIIFGMNAGCLMDVSAYAMQYAADSADRPTLGCGIIIDGVQAEFIPMDFTQKKYRR